MERKTDLTKVILTLHTPRGFPGRLDRREEQGDQKADNRDHDKEFNQRESASIQTSNWLKIGHDATNAVRLPSSQST